MATNRLFVRNGRIPYSMSVTLNDRVFELYFRWDARENHWFLDIGQGGVITLNGVVVVHSEDLLAQFSYKKILGLVPEGTIRVYDTTDNFNDPDTDTFGETVLFLYVEA